MPRPGSRERKASSRSAEPSRPVRRTRQASRAQQAAEAANGTVKSAASPEPLHDVLEVAARSPADDKAVNSRYDADDKYAKPARRFAAPARDGTDGGNTSPATRDFFQEENTVLTGMTPAGTSFVMPKRGAGERVGWQAPAAGDGQVPEMSDVQIRDHRGQGDVSPSAATKDEIPEDGLFVEESDYVDQQDADGYESSASESDREIQRPPDRPRYTYLDGLHISDEPTITATTGLGQNPGARWPKPFLDNTRTAPRQYQRGNQNASEYLNKARANLSIPKTPRTQNQSPNREPLRGSSQINRPKRQRTIDEKDEEDDAFETDNRPAKQRRSGGENGRTAASAHDSIQPSNDVAAVGRKWPTTNANTSNGFEANVLEGGGAAGAQAHNNGFAIQDAVANTEEDDAASAQAQDDGLAALDVITVTQKARETALKHRSGTKKPQDRKPWTGGDTAKLIAAIGQHGCSWSSLEHLLSFSTPRNQQQIRDKARNIKVDFLLGDTPLPHGFDGIALGKKEREKVISCERNPDRNEADVDELGKVANCKYTGEEV